MLQVPPTGMFRSAYQQISAAERHYVDTLVAEIATSAARHGRPVSDALDAPLPQALIDADKRGWLQRPLVLAAVYQRVQDQALRDDISLESTAREIHAIAHSDLADYFEQDIAGDLVMRPLDEIPPEKRRAIAQIDIEKSEGGFTRGDKMKIRLKFHDKIAALKMEMALMGVEDGDNPYRKSTRGDRIPQITDQTTADQAADEYARMIGDD